MGERNIGDLIQLAKDLLTINCGSDAGRWRAHLRELERSEYEEILSQLFERYFDIIRCPGWSLRPEVRVTSWIQADIEIRVARRTEILESEWRFLTELLPRLQVSMSLSRACTRRCFSLPLALHLYFQFLIRPPS